MRILAITNLYPRPGRPTLAPFNRQQFAALASRHELAVVAPVAWTEELRDRWAGRGVVRRRRDDGGIEVRHPRYAFPPRIARASLGGFYLASVRGEASGLLRDFRPDAVLACWAHPDGWAAVRLAREASVPCVIKVVGSDVLVLGRSGRRRARVAEALRSADAVAAVGRDLADRVVALGVDPARVRVVPEGLDGTLFRPGDRQEARARLGLVDDGPIVLFVGNLLLSKGAGVLIEAFARLARSNVPARCVLVGRGPDEARLRSIAARLGLTDRITFAGPRTLEELPDWYRACRVVALPSFSEGTPNVLREAAACGRPIVASRVGGVPEVVEGASALLVPPGDPEALAGALAEALALDQAPPRPWISWAESASRLADLLSDARGLDPSRRTSRP